tara:strand:+ start:14345 stop:14944 length:600 start_codon:yes stop_codon:yes gene_type:complete
MKIIVLLFLCALVASCASVAPSRGLSGYENVELKPWIYGAQAVSGVTFSYAAPASIGNDLGYCVAQHVSNRQVDVKDDSQSYFGAYTGNYYRVERSRSVDGGEVIMYASKDGASVAAQGSAVYQLPGMIPVDKVIRFNMALSNKEGKTEYVFSNIEVAQLDTGIIANSGFQPLGAHKHASPELALNALKAIAEKIQRCI